MSARIWTMPGGVHPPAHKQASTRRPIAEAALPARLIIPVQQHVGNPATPVVAIGEYVLKGQRLAEAQGFVSVPVHASTSGTVVDIGRYPTDHPSQIDSLCIVLAPDGRDEWLPHEGLADWRQADPVELIERVRAAGVAGLGGAGFPTAAKLTAEHETRIDTVVINGMECEPYITADDMQMRERAHEIIEGTRIIQHILRAPTALVGIEDNKPEAIRAMQRAADGTDVAIRVAPTKYPSGAARQTVYILTGREVPNWGHTIDVGVFCCNTGTAAAVYRAIVHGEPLISRITTVSGAGVREPRNLDVRIGTPVGDLIRQCGGDPAQLSRLILGGPMMGVTLHEATIPVTKLTNCLIAATAQDFPPPPPEQPCIRCGACSEACPVALLPQQLLWFAKAGEFEKAEKHHLRACIECGACAYVCPSNIPLVQYYRHAKGELRAQAEEKAKAEASKQRFEARQTRLTQDEAEREVKRQARLAAAQAHARSTANDTASAMPTPPSDTKSLTIAAAMARVGLKKAEKALAVAVEANEPTDALVTEVERLKAEVAKIEAELLNAASGVKTGGAEPKGAEPA